MRQDQIIVLTRVNILADLSAANDLFKLDQSKRNVSLSKVSADIVGGLWNMGADGRSQAVDEFLVDDRVGDLGFYELGDSFACFTDILGAFGVGEFLDSSDCKCKVRTLRYAIKNRTCTAAFA